MKHMLYEEGQADMLEQILSILDDLEEEYYNSRPTTMLALYPLKEAKRVIVKLTGKD